MSRTSPSRSPRRRRRRRDRLTAASVACLALLVFLWLLEARVAERHWAATALTYLPQQPFAVPSAALLLASLIGRNFRAAAVNLAALAFVTFTLLGFRIPLARPLPESADLRVLTFNVHMGSHGSDRVIETIRAADPDVFCLQEAAPGLRSDLPSSLRRAFPDYRFAASGGLLTASRLPVTGIRERPFNERGLWRKALQVDVRVGGRTVRVINTHFITARSGHGEARDNLFSPPHWREAGAVRMLQASAIAGWARAAEGPVVVVGDFNTPPRGLTYGTLTRRLRNAFDATGRGFGYTWNTRLPVMRIDHVFAGGGAVPVSARVPDVIASDHRPVLAGIALARE